MAILTHPLVAGSVVYGKFGKNIVLSIALLILAPDTAFIEALLMLYDGSTVDNPMTDDIVTLLAPVALFQYR